ncbi:uncharacterized protein N7479_010100 [Penicillium vulpinum]|uniref:uncharacterized protein n=1 Tax=Penicillium vulpinum TaxID=29845 RepID=UPI0025493383|nr:uncharacterized protein N7479_010100 [Penicillium vulpinum]KAJ5951687.1 hypothetical protein N7479_010100 [Penicillium vulpinum]
MIKTNSRVWLLDEMVQVLPDDVLEILVGLVQLVNPKLVLYLVGEIDKRVGIHNIAQGLEV